MSRTFNADDKRVGASHFWVNLRPQVGMSTVPNVSDAQLPGRHLSALLAAERALGVRVDDEVVERHARVAFFSYGGSVALPLGRDSLEGDLAAFRPVDVAHGLNALYALTAFRDSEQAQELAEASIQAIGRLWDPVSGWDRTHIEGQLGLSYRDAWPDAPFIAGLAMAIGPLAKLYSATGSGTALQLATALKDKVVAEFFLADGTYDPERLGTHIHNVVYVMASLAWLATATRDDALMTRVRTFYGNGLLRMRNAIGWSPEFVGRPPRLSRRGTNADRGEAGNTALILETALLLGAWGDASAYADAELMLRSHLLPSQLRDVSFISAPENAGGLDGLTNIAQRIQGAWGFPAPYGHQPLGDSFVGVGLDIVGAVVASLVEAQAHVVRREAQGVRINLLFDHASDGIVVSSPYTSDGLAVTLRQPEPVMIRLPSWAPYERVHLTGASMTSPDPTTGYVTVNPRDTSFRLRFPFPTRDFHLTSEGGPIRARARGDQIVAMDGRGTDLTFFDALAG